MSFTCRYCNKDFRKESSLLAHLCEPKRRWQQEKETGVQLGLKAYLRFYEITQGSAKLKSYKDFVASPYYSAFVKYGRYLVAIRAVNTTSFTEWLLRNNKKLDNWCKDTLYTEWLFDYMKKESVQDALERAFKEMQEYADDQTSSTVNFNDYFRVAGNSLVCYHITTGRISPWIVYNCASGIAVLDTLNEEQVAMILPWIDPEFWQRKFQDFMADTEWIKDILKSAGL